MWSRFGGVIKKGLQSVSLIQFALQSRVIELLKEVGLDGGTAVGKGIGLKGLFWLVWSDDHAFQVSVGCPRGYGGTDLGPPWSVINSGVWSGIVFESPTKGSL